MGLSCGCVSWGLPNLSNLPCNKRYLTWLDLMRSLVSGRTKGCPTGQVLISPPPHAGHHGRVRVIKCKVKVIKCNVRVIEGRINGSLRSGHWGQVIECMLLLLLLLLLHESRDFTRSRTKSLNACCWCLCVFWSLKANVWAGRGMGLTRLHTCCHCQHANEVSNSDIIISNMQFWFNVLTS